MAFICPYCERELVNRKSKRCLYCGKELPNELLLSEEQIDTLGNMAAGERKRHKGFLKWLDDHRPRYYT